MQAIAERFITEAEFLEWEERQEAKHEYFNGRIYAMSGGSNRHAVICTNVTTATSNRLRGKPCRAVGSEQRVKIEETGLLTYPDASIYCPPSRFEGKDDCNLLTPTVLFEVLSPSTARFDQGNKFEHYKLIPTLRDYVLVHQTRAQVDHFHRHENGWLLVTARGLDESIRLESVAIELPLNELYDDIEFPPGPLPLRELAEDEVVDGSELSGH